MGVSSNAILFYGFCFSEQCTVPDEDEWVEAILRGQGERNPWDNWPEIENSKLPYQQRRAAEDAWTAEHRAELDAWYAKKSAIQEDFGCEVSYHCSGDYPVPYVHITTSKLLVSRGYPEVVTAATLAVGDDWPAKLDRFMQAIGIEKPEGQVAPGWWLVSFMG